MPHKSKKTVIKVDRKDLKSERIPLPKQLETAFTDRQEKRKNKGLSRRQLHKLHE